MAAAGIFLESYLGIPFFWSLAIGTSVVLVYSIFGGFLSVAVTDGLQFILLIAGITGLFIFLSGSSSMNQVSVYASELVKPGYFNIFFNFKENILIVFSFTLAWTISPIAWQRIQAARTDTSARVGLFATSGTLFLLYWIVVFIGMLSLPLVFSGRTEGPLLSVLISSKTGVLLGGILFVAVMAAVMSTMDTAINTGALSLTRDVYQQVYPQRKGKEIVFASRFSTFIVGGVAFLVAMKFQSILKTLGLASEIMAEGLFVPGIAMIFLRKKLPLAGFLSLLLGGGYSIAGFLCELGLLPLSWPKWPYSVPYGFGLSLAGFAVGFGAEKFMKKKK
jgi:SSS family solute:Na+ symporter